MINFANDMNKKQVIKLFEEQKVRMEWDDEKEKWFFSIVDVCGVLTIVKTISPHVNIGIS